MLNQFLKIAGVKTQKEFYNKYPSEDAFFKAHPEAQHLKTMARGGSASSAHQQQVAQLIQAYAQAQGVNPKQIMQQLQQMPPQQQQQALQQMAQAVQSGGAQPQQGIAPGYGSGAMPMAMYGMAVGGNKEKPMGPFEQRDPNAGTPDYGTYQAAQQQYTQQAQQQADAASAATPTAPLYNGNSIVDLLAGQNKAFDIGTRKKLAASLGINNYRGSADQNQQLINMVNANPDVLKNIGSESNIPKRKDTAPNSLSGLLSSIGYGNDKASIAKLAASTPMFKINGYTGTPEQQKRMMKVILDNPQQFGSPKNKNAGMEGVAGTDTPPYNDGYFDPSTLPQVANVVDQSKLEQPSMNTFGVPQAQRAPMGAIGAVDYTTPGYDWDKNKPIHLPGTNKTINPHALSDYWDRNKDAINFGLTGAALLTGPGALKGLQWGTKLYPYAGEAAEAAGTYGQKALPYGQKALNYATRAMERWAPDAEYTPYWSEQLPSGQKLLEAGQNLLPAAQRALGFANGGAYGNVPQHAHPGTYGDGYSGTSNGGQYFDLGGFFNSTNPFGDIGEGMRDGSLVRAAAGVLPMAGMENKWASKNGKNLQTDLTKYLSSNPNATKEDIQKMLSGYAEGGMAAPGYVPEYGSQAYAPSFAFGGVPLPQYRTAGLYYPDGGEVSPEEQAAMAQQQGQPDQGQQQAPEQQGGGQDQQQIVQAIAQMLQQGMQPQDILQKLVQMGVPQAQAQQLVQAVMQQMQGGQQQGPQEEQTEGAQGQEPPQQEAAEGQPMGRYGGTFAYGGVNNLSRFVGQTQEPDLAYLHNSYQKARGGMVGQEMEVTPAEMEQLRKQGYKFDLI